MMKKLVIGLLCIIIGIGAMAIGFTGLFTKYGQQPLSDAEVKARAKALGMVEIKELIDEN